jgi:type II secretory pathway predicted ATPase ExeA
MLTGEYGCGKTTLSRALIQRLEAGRFEIGLLTNPSWNGVDFLSEILYQLGVETPEKSKPELLHLLNDLFFRNYQNGRDTVIIVDEAQLIDDQAVFEELRLLMNFQTDERFLVTVVLIGSPELVPKVRSLRHLDQRISLRYHLNTLDAGHSARYIAHRLHTAGRREPIFTPEAIRLIFDFTRGTPREINTVCDLALLVGYTRQLHSIDDKIIAEVIATSFVVARRSRPSHRPRKTTRRATSLSWRRSPSARPPAPSILASSSRRRPRRRHRSRHCHHRPNRRRARPCRRWPRRVPTAPHPRRCSPGCAPSWSARAGS